MAQRSRPRLGRTRAAGATTNAASSSQARPATALAPHRRRWIAVAFFAGALTLYLANGRTTPFAGAGDTIPSRLIPFSILRFGTVTMDPFGQAFADHGGYRWYVQQRRGHLVSFYPIGTAFVALPVFTVVYLRSALLGRTSAEDLFDASPGAEKLAASVLTAGAVSLLWLVIAGRAGPRRAAAITAVTAACTLLWPVASQLLWQHTAGVFLLSCALWLSHRQRTPPLALGLVFGLWFAVRPQSFVFGAALGIALVVTSGGGPPVRRLRTLATFAAGVLVIAAPSLAYNHYYYGNWLGGYSMATGLFGGRWLLEGIAGLLLSPNRGLLVLMPVALVGIAGAFRVLREPRREPLLSALVVAGLLYFVLHAATRTWAGGWCFGPRYLTEVIPLLAVCATRPAPRAGWLLRTAIGLCIVWSFAMQLAGSWFYPASNWNARMGADLEQASWDGGHFMPWEDFEVWRAARRLRSARRAVAYNRPG